MYFIGKCNNPALHDFKILIYEASDLNVEEALQEYVKYFNTYIGPDGRFTTLFWLQLASLTWSTNQKTNP